jgi:thioesterase domain-containing protein
MASRYLEEIRQAQPDGPYCLGGYSIGGLIAFEAAQQLIEAGQRIALLAMFDSWAPGYPAEGLVKLGDHVIELFQRAPWTWPAYLRQRAGYWLARRAEQTRTYDGGRSAVYVLEQAILPAVRAKYAPRPYPGRIELFRCLEDRVLWRRTPELGWRGVAGQGIGIHDLPATHQNLLAEPAVEVLARRLASCLAEAQART